MKSIYILLGAAMVFNACKKHEIVPAPEEKAELKVHFKGNINGTLVEFTENVEGFTGTTTQGTVQPAAPALSTATYFSKMSGNSARAISVGLGALAWDPSVSGTPSLAQFNSFNNTNLSPDYAVDLLPGFLVTWTDSEARIWTSKGTPYHLDQDAEFTRIVQESDKEGDYSKFRVNFNTFVYRTYRVAVIPATLPATYDTITDSLHIVDGVYDGWFKLQK